MRELLEKFGAAKNPDAIQETGQALLASIRTNEMLIDEAEALRILLRQQGESLSTMKQSDPLKKIIGTIGAKLANVRIQPTQIGKIVSSPHDSSISFA